MQVVRFHPDPGEPTRQAGDGAEFGGRLNLLVTCAGWQSETWADRLPRVLEPLGVQSVRARSAVEAERVIYQLPVHIALLDLGLPLDPSRGGEEGGARVLELLARLEARPPMVVIKSSRSPRDESRALSAALRLGAFAVVDRTAADVETMLRIMQRCLLRHYRGRWPAGGGPADDSARGGERDSG